MAEHPIMSALRNDPAAMEALLNRLEKMLAAAEEMDCTGLATMWPAGDRHGLRIGWVHPFDDGTGDVAPDTTDDEGVRS